MLKIKIPNICYDEQAYVIELILKEFLGIEFNLGIHEEQFIEITRNSHLEDLSKLTLDLSFFHNANHNWLKSKSMPTLPLADWLPQRDGITADLVEPIIPIIYGSPGLKKKNNHYHLNLDIFGSVFFMLSRYEELIMKDRDNHSRFPSYASLSYKASFLNRPIVDEYLEILWSCLQKLWPDLKRKNCKPNTFLTCDLDQPFDCSVETFSKTIKACLGDLVKRKSIIEMIKRINRYMFNKLGIYKFDKNYTFDEYMNKCEKAGLKAAFYIIPSSKEPVNGCYEITDKKIIKLLKKIVARGHEIGIHGSYQTYQDKNKIINQKLKVEKTLQNIGINQKIKGNRQHYLRWDSALTPDYLDEAGFEYDTSGAYADHPGFRYGTSKEFSMWSWQRKKKLSLKQRPLILMECSIAYYMGLGYSDEALRIMIDLKQKCKKVKGVFTILWHNSELKDKNQIDIFDRIIVN